MAKNEKVKAAPEKAKAKKTKKAEKKVSAKKLPGLFKKAYTDKDFEKKILNKLYIPEDKNYVASLFSGKVTKKGKTLKCISADAEFSKKELKRIKALAKSISKNKGRFKVVPFAAVACFIVAIGIAVTVFKNPVTKMLIKNGMQSVFAAKCDIGSVNVEIFGAQITVKNLAQANKDEPMKNIFEFEKLDLDFDLAQLLRGRFDAQNIEITGVALGTERTTSGELPLKKIEQKVEEAKDESGFYASLKEKKGSALEAAKASLGGAVSEYNPKAVAEELKASFASAQTAKEVEQEMKSLVEKWKATPASLKSQTAEFEKNAKALSNLNTSSLKTPADVAAALEKVNAAITSGNKVKELVNETVTSFTADKEKASELTKKLNDAVAADKASIENQVSKYTSFSVSEGKSIITGALDSVAYEVLGQYYPYLHKAISYAGSLKSSGSSSQEAQKKEKAKKEKAKKESKRYAGRDVYWKADRIPTFLIEKAHASGTGFEAFASNISNDMDKRGEPWSANGRYVASKNTHTGSLIVDARSASNADLITASYNGSNYPFAIKSSTLIGSDGMPDFNGTTSIASTLTANADYSFGVKASFAMNPVTVTATALSQEKVNRVYQNALKSIKTMNLGATAHFAPDGGIDLKLTSDADKKIIEAMKSAVSAEASTQVNEAKAKALASLNDQTSGALSQVSAFSGISSDITSSASGIDSLQKQLDAKKAELTKQAASAASSKATGAAASAVKGLLKK